MRCGFRSSCGGKCAGAATTDERDLPDMDAKNGRKSPVQASAFGVGEVRASPVFAGLDSAGTNLGQERYIVEGK